MRRKKLLQNIASRIIAMRRMLELVEHWLELCEQGPTTKPIDFELIRVARSKLTTALEPVERCEAMTGRELRQFYRTLKRARRAANRRLFAQGETTVMDFQYDDTDEGSPL